jgi:hypothetical protein
MNYFVPEVLLTRLLRLRLRGLVEAGFVELFAIAFSFKYSNLDI